MVSGLGFRKFGLKKKRIYDLGSRILRREAPKVNLLLHSGNWGINKGSILGQPLRCLGLPGRLPRKVKQGSHLGCPHYFKPSFGSFGPTSPKKSRLNLPCSCLNNVDLGGT